MDTIALALSFALFVCVIVSLMAGFPVAFTLAGVSLGFAFVASLFGAFDLSLFGALPARLFSVVQSEILVAVPLFVFMGVVLERSRVAEDLLNSVSRLFGKTRGGLGIAVCIVGALMAASTGIVGATVVTMGMISLPAMLKAGYKPSFAAGTIAASGTLGQIVPPSIVLVILGDQLAGAFSQAQYRMGNFAPDAVSVNDLFAGAIIPGLLLVAAYVVWIIVRVTISPGDAPPADPGQLAPNDAPERSLITTLLAPLSLIVAVLGSILAGVASPTEAASIGAVGALLLAGLAIARQASSSGVLIKLGGLAMILTPLIVMFGGPVWLKIGTTIIVAIGVFSATAWLMLADNDDDLPLLTDCVRKTLSMTTMIFMVLVGASVFSLVFRGLEGDVVVEHLLTNLPGGVPGALLVVMLTMFLLGFVLDFLEIVFIVVPVVAPVLLMMEIAPGVHMSPIWLGVLIAMNLQTSFLTPPFGFALFYLRGVAPPAVTTVDIYTGIVPFVMIQLAMLALLWWYPALATWLPGL